MTKEQKENNKRLYDAAKPVTFSQVPMTDQEHDTFSRTTLRKAKCLRHCNAAFVVCGFGLLTYCFLHYYNPPISYICAACAVALMVFGLLSVSASASGDNKLLTICKFPDEQKGLKAVDVETNRLFVSTSNLDNVVTNCLLIDDGEYILDAAIPSSKMEELLQNYSTVRIYFYEQSTDHHMQTIHIQHIA